MYNYKNKNIGIIGLGVTGRSAINFFGGGLVKSLGNPGGVPQPPAKI